MNPTQIPEPLASTPIEPAFIKPIKPAFLKFQDDEKAGSIASHESNVPIMRGDKEDSFPMRSQGTGVGARAPKLGQRLNAEGDDFWRRFSMVAKMDTKNPAENKQRYATSLVTKLFFDRAISYSPWLKSATRGTTALRGWTWCIGIFMLLAIIGGSVAGWWFSRDDPAHAVPVAIGGGTLFLPVGLSSKPDGTIFP